MGDELKRPIYHMVRQDSRTMAKLGNAIGGDVGDWLENEGKRNTANPGRAVGKAAQYAATWYLDRKSTRLNSSHSQISYAVFCLKKKKKKKQSLSRNIHTHGRPWQRSRTCSCSTAPSMTPRSPRATTSKIRRHTARGSCRSTSTT